MAILHSKDWDPSCLHAQNQHLVLPPKLIDKSIPWGVGQELIVDATVNPQGANIYIDDLITLTIDIPGTDKVVQGQATALLAIDASARRNHYKEPIPQECMDTRHKLKAKAGLEEQKMILGWLFDFHRL